MKKQQVKSLSLKKKVISNFSKNSVQGGTGLSVNQSCIGAPSCGNCTAGCPLTPECHDPDFTANQGSQCLCK